MAERFVESTGDVTDNHTGNVWLANLAAAPMSTLKDARAAVTAGYRLPTVAEVKSLMALKLGVQGLPNSNGIGPFVDGEAFTNAPGSDGDEVRENAAFWTSDGQRFKLFKGTLAAPGRQGTDRAYVLQFKE